jgi:hypothetical protein
MAEWKDNFAASKFWNHNFAGNLSPFCSQSDVFKATPKVIFGFRPHQILSKRLRSILHPQYKLDRLVFDAMPFANLVLWKHILAKAAKLWVKLQPVRLN